MEQLKAKLKKQGGFTMVELLIVVAIIAILVAVSIPMMNQALEKSRHAVDQANVRDAIGLISVEYTSNPDAFKETADQTYKYCVDPKTHQGYLSKETGAEGVKPQCTCNDCDAKTVELSVTLKPSADTAVGSKPEITTTWYYDATTGTECTKKTGP
ncbi:type IV pilin protein [uncultured Oscillibacter sp.]|uniref:type IV pilin protein n=1 Tax=uncultured Oscillibacter sp. TaxID=876091 RepID=UPI0025EC10E5|nr:type II secretion system protein [uncultured Oscillibacter sp.]